MKTSKKLLSILLSIILVLSAIAVLGTGASADGPYSVGDIIEYGTYPQSEVSSETLVEELNAILQDADWISYGYYTGSGNGWGYDGLMTANDFMRYADIVYKSQKYRAVTFDKFRPYGTTQKANTSGDNILQDENGYECGTVYWFRYEPLQWRVLDPATGFVLCEKAIDAQPINNYIRSEADEYWGSEGMVYYANSYADSSIRTWLTGNFYNTAFSASQKGNILTTAVDNSETHSYSSSNTSDKVFLLSESEAKTTAYGFTSTVSQTETRVTVTTDYAKCQGINSTGSENSSWWLRTGGLHSGSSCLVSRNGYIDTNVQSYYTNLGIRPAMRLNTIKNDTQVNLPSEYRASFFADGTLVENRLYTPGATSITEPSVPEKAGYTGSWPSYMLNGFINVDAVYTLINYTATFVDKNGETIDTKTFTVETESLEEPSVPEKEGYTGEWSDYTLALSDITIQPEYTPIDYTATFVDENGETVDTKTFTVETEALEEPAVPEKEGYSGEWNVYTLAASDITIQPKYTPIEYTATFVDANGETLETKTFTVETESLDEPAVPEKVNYNGEWEEYTLGAEDITIKPVYTLAGETKVTADCENEITLDYKESKRYAFELEFVPEGATAHVFYNGEDRGEGTSIEVKEPTGDYTVECKVLDADGNEIATSGEIKVKVKNSFFDRLRWFFNNFWANILKTFIEAIIKAC